MCAIFGVCSAQTPKPKRINKAIELLENGQPVYYVRSHDGTAGGFEQCKKDAQTNGDYIRRQFPFRQRDRADSVRRNDPFRN